MQNRSSAPGAANGRGGLAAGFAGDRRSLFAGFLCGALFVALLFVVVLPALANNPAAGGTAAQACAAGTTANLLGLFGPAATCNFVQPLFSPGSGDEIISLIRSAKTSIDVEMYVFTDENLARELTDAAGRGVKVRVLLEPRVESSSLNSIAQGLDAGGAEVRWASVRYQLTHAKMMIVDKKQALVGSINFSKAAQNKNREVDVLLEGPALSQLVQTFEQDWADGSLVRAG